MGYVSLWSCFNGGDWSGLDRQTPNITLYQAYFLESIFRPLIFLTNHDASKTWCKISMLLITLICPIWWIFFSFFWQFLMINVNKVVIEKLSFWIRLSNHWKTMHSAYLSVYSLDILGLKSSRVFKVISTWNF